MCSVRSKGPSAKVAPKATHWRRDPVPASSPHRGPAHVDAVRTLMVSRGYSAAIWTISPAAPLIACTAIGCRNLRVRELTGMVVRVNAVRHRGLHNTRARCYRSR